MTLLLHLALLTALTPAPPAASRQQVVSARAGAVTRVEGEVIYHCHDKEDGVGKLEAGVRLHAGDLVFTAEQGSATLTLNPDSYLMVAANSSVRVYGTELDRMHFDVQKGEVFVLSRSLGEGASLVVHTPPGLLTVHKPGRYRFSVAEGGETEADVVRGELRYTDGRGRLVRVKERRKVRFIKSGKPVTH